MTYSDEDLEEEEAWEPCQELHGTDGYLMIYQHYVGGLGCGHGSIGLLQFGSAYHALLWLRKQVVILVGRRLPEPAYNDLLRRVDGAISQIRQSKSDEGVQASVAGFETRFAWQYVLCEGYWDQAVPKMLAYLEAEFEQDAGKEDDAPDGIESTPERCLRVCRKLLQCSDTRSDSFVEEFGELLTEFDYWRA